MPLCSGIVTWVKLHHKIPRNMSVLKWRIENRHSSETITGVAARNFPKVTFPFKHTQTHPVRDMRCSRHINRWKLLASPTYDITTFHCNGSPPNCGTYTPQLAPAALTPLVYTWELPNVCIGLLVYISIVRQNGDLYSYPVQGITYKW